MEYFSEIYSKYYRAVAAVLKKARRIPLSSAEINDIIQNTAFGESGVYITPRLTDGSWPLLQRRDEGFTPVTEHDPPVPLTALQRAWLTAVLEDERCSLFLTEEERREVRSALDSPPLYELEYMRNIDISADGDDYSDIQYAAQFRQLLQAVRERRLLFITYTGGKGAKIKGDYLPCRLEYSPKDDKFRLLAVRIRCGKAIFTTTINLARIDQIGLSMESFDELIDFDQFSKTGRVQEPVTVEITDRRNALERFMVQFASYDKRTRYDDDTDKYICNLYYSKNDETELLIHLLSFGPVVRVLSPDSFVSLMRERIMKQKELLESI